MKEIIKFLGFDDTGASVLGGFFTAHDTHGFGCDWFMPMFLEKGCRVSIPYFAAECLQHPLRDPNMIWDMLQTGYKEARVPIDILVEKEKLNSYFAWKWTQIGKPTLQILAETVMKEQEAIGKAWENEVEKALNIVDLPKKNT